MQKRTKILICLLLIVIIIFSFIINIYAYDNEYYFIQYSVNIFTNTASVDGINLAFSQYSNTYNDLTRLQTVGFRSNNIDLDSGSHTLTNLIQTNLRFRIPSVYCDENSIFNFIVPAYIYLTKYEINNEQVSNEIIVPETGIQRYDGYIYFLYRDLNGTQSTYRVTVPNLLYYPPYGFKFDVSLNNLPSYVLESIINGTCDIQFSYNLYFSYTFDYEAFVGYDIGFGSVLVYQPNLNFIVSDSEYQFDELYERISDNIQSAKSQIQDSIGTGSKSIVDQSIENTQLIQQEIQNVLEVENNVYNYMTDTSQGSDQANFVESSLSKSNEQLESYGDALDGLDKPEVTFPDIPDDMNDTTISDGINNTISHKLVSPIIAVVGLLITISLLLFGL